MAADVQDTPEHGDSKSNIEETATSFSGIESMALVESVQTWRYKVDARQHGFFLAKKDYGSSSADSEETNISDDGPQSRATTPETSPYSLHYSWVIGSLAKYEDGFFDGVDAADQFVCFADPSTYKEYPGWMLRNLLVLIRTRWGLDKVQVLCYRDIQSRREDARSMILSLTLEVEKRGPQAADSVSRERRMPKVSGWERSNNGKISSRIANLGEYMNPQRYDCNGIFRRAC